ncbi:MAG: tetratricopeptide repeat protein [Archaeoglobi archaeon]|nr:tetratricopeptide repeat protein [Candidatus Mnemosynella bozhongmuii]
MQDLFSCDHPEVALSMRLLGQIYEQEGKIEEASSLYQEAYRIQREALGENHPETRKTVLLLKEIGLKG